MPLRVSELVKSSSFSEGLFCAYRFKRFWKPKCGLSESYYIVVDKSRDSSIVQNHTETSCHTHYVIHYDKSAAPEVSVGRFCSFSVISMINLLIDKD